MDNSSLLLWSLLFSSIGLGYFSYGKKQGALVPLLIGMVLLVFPYFIESLGLLLTVGCLLVAIPYFFRR